MDWKNMSETSSPKNILNCLKIQTTLKNKTRLVDNFIFKGQISKDLTSGVIYKFQCGLCNGSLYGQCVKNLSGGSGEDIDKSPPPKKQVKPKNSPWSFTILQPVSIPQWL